MMLGILAAALGWGCSGHSPSWSNEQVASGLVAQPGDRRPADAARAPRDPAPAGPRLVSGEGEPSAAAPVDVGMDRPQVPASVRAALDDMVGQMTIRQGGTTVVQTMDVRNYSRAGAGVFQGARTRLITLLEIAASDRGVQVSFVDGPTTTAAYELHGSAYLVRDDDGGEAWEFYLWLSPARRAWAVWRGDQPIRLR